MLDCRVLAFIVTLAVVWTCESGPTNSTSVGEGDDDDEGGEAEPSRRMLRDYWRGSNIEEATLGLIRCVWIRFLRGRRMCNDVVMGQ